MAESLETLRDELKFREKGQALLLAIDHIRDTTPEPTAILAAIVDVLTDTFQADLCLVALINQETGEVELQAVNSYPQPFDQAGLAITGELAEQATKLDEVTIWTENKLPATLRQMSWPTELYLAAVPIIKGTKERLGALLLARSQVPFSPPEVKLLKLAESQIDSAVVQIYAYYELQQRNKELETIYRIDRIHDQYLPFDKMLNAVLQELLTVIRAEMGFIMLYNWTRDRLELQATTPHNLASGSPHYHTIEQVANEALQQNKVICRSDLEDEVHSVICIPLILYNAVIGILGLVNGYQPHGFKAEDCRMLKGIASQIDTTIFESMERRRFREALSRSVGPKVLERIMTDPDMNLVRNEQAVLTVLYTDIRGSTRLAERTAPELMLGFLNDYLGRMTEIVLAQAGTVDKFTGDGVMALFGAPFPLTDHALRAAQVGLAMQAAHQTVMAAWQKRGVEAAPIGIGIATGELIVGEVGYPQRTEYTAIGRAANLGAHLCSAAKAGQILISQTTYDRVRGKIEARPIRGMKLKGIDRDMTVYEVIREP